MAEYQLTKHRSAYAFVKETGGETTTCLRCRSGQAQKKTMKQSRASQPLPVAGSAGQLTGLLQSPVLEYGRTASSSVSDLMDYVPNVDIVQLGQV